MCVFVCTHVCARFSTFCHLPSTYFSACVCARTQVYSCVCARSVRACVCVCVSARARACVCVCVCVRERECVYVLEIHTLQHILPLAKHFHHERLHLVNILKHQRTFRCLRSLLLFHAATSSRELAFANFFWYRYLRRRPRNGLTMSLDCVEHRVQFAS